MDVDLGAAACVGAATGGFAAGAAFVGAVDGTAAGGFGARTGACVSVAVLVLGGVAERATAGGVAALACWDGVGEGAVGEWCMGKSITDTGLLDLISVCALGLGDCSGVGAVRRAFEGIFLVASF